MRVVAIIQARMGSTRLPGKVLRDLGGVTMLARVVRRVLDARTVDHVVIATTTLPEDKAIAEEARKLDTAVYRGSVDDVLARYVGAARMAQADAIVRITADCPLIDGGVIDEIVARIDRRTDYASNTHVRTFPRGLDAEVLHRDTLDRIARLATSAAAREHVTSFIMESPGLFQVAQVIANSDESDLRWTVDTEDDLTMMQALHRSLGVDEDRLGYRELVRRVRSHPDLASINAHVVQKPWSSHVE